MAAPRILRTHYKNLSHDNLALFVQNVYSRMSSQAEYAAYAAELARLGQQFEAYKHALAQSVSGGVDRTAIKKECIQKLFHTLDQIVDRLNWDHNGLSSWGVHAGLVVGHGRKQHPLELPAPIQLQVQHSGKPGEAILRYKMPERRRVYANVAEYSLDKGKTWHHAAYSSNSKIHLRELPSKQKVWFRVCSTGAAQRKSVWTELVEIFVM